MTGRTVRAGRPCRLGLVALVPLVILAGCTNPPATPVPPAIGAPVVADPLSWAASVRRSIDGNMLPDEGLQLPDGANVVAVRIYDGGSSPAYSYFEAGGGAFSEQFFPASSIKLLAALGALDYARQLGFTGAALVDGEYSIRDYYDAALRWSSNEDYDELVRIAGVDRLNQQFLPDHGFPGTAIQEPYGGNEQVTDSPEMDLSEGDHEVDVPEREGAADYGCNAGNCSSLFEMTDALRRVVLDAELPAADRFDLDPSDIAGLTDALAGAEGFIAPGVADALGPDARLYTKPGWVPYLDCVETSLIVDPNTGHRFLLGLSAPDDGTCDELSTMAHDVLTLLDACDDGTAMRADGSRVAIVAGKQTRTVPGDGPVTMACHLR
ncbi:MAG TPA: hypothetical protein VHT97_07625 [Acidimicrobiales bacterium]|jgi:hypothetical protein|nr:hypothetical protein [Acidimicrobiales bacterium]